MKTTNEINKCQSTMQPLIWNQRFYWNPKGSGFLDLSLHAAIKSAMFGLTNYIQFDDESFDCKCTILDLWQLAMNVRNFATYFEWFVSNSKISIMHTISVDVYILDFIFWKAKIMIRNSHSLCLLWRCWFFIIDIVSQLPLWQST